MKRVELGEDDIGRFGPNEGLGIVVVFLQVAVTAQTQQEVVVWLFARPRNHRDYGRRSRHNRRRCRGGDTRFVGPRDPENGVTDHGTISRLAWSAALSANLLGGIGSSFVARIFSITRSIK
jgi:hypothetical protein